MTTMICTPQVKKYGKNSKSTLFTRNELNDMLAAEKDDEPLSFDRMLGVHNERDDTRDADYQGFEHMLDSDDVKDKDLIEENTVLNTLTVELARKTKLDKILQQRFEIVSKLYNVDVKYLEECAGLITDMFCTDQVKRYAKNTDLLFFQFKDLQKMINAN
jgi:hypothetical protein